jgi:protein tyrosine/serine phosphatase
MSQKTNKIIKIAGGISVLAVVFLWYIGVLTQNFHTVSGGKVYRSKQLSYNALSERIRENGIRSVVNLRGGNPGDEFYRDEMHACFEANIRHFDVPMSAVVLPEPLRLRQLLTVFDSADYPVLVHCNHGADRTGLACTIYKIVYEGYSLDSALSECLSWKFGHFFFGQARAMDEFFDLYRSRSDNLDLRTWIFSEYDSIYTEKKKN